MTGKQRNPKPASLACYSCSKDEWIAMRDLGLEMIAMGVCSEESTPLRAYSHQRTAAINRRKIAFNLTLMEWWGIWEASGRWADRGIGRGWHMCRVGDVGPYEVGNVFIGEGAINLSDAGKVARLPIGVAFFAKGRLKPFRAYCNVYGRQRHIGLFSTVEEAEAAYLEAVRLDGEMKALADERFDELKAQVQKKHLTVVAMQAANAAKAVASRVGAAA